MSQEPDPRVYFAAERTLLAWLRTGIAVIGLGFLVARFGVFLMLLRGAAIESNHSVSTFIGIGFVLLGAVMIAIATWQHLKFTRTLDQGERPEHYSVRFSLSIAALVAVSAVALAGYLAVSFSHLSSSDSGTRINGPSAAEQSSDLN